MPPKFIRPKLVFEEGVVFGDKTSNDENVERKSSCPEGEFNKILEVFEDNISAEIKYDYPKKISDLYITLDENNLVKENIVKNLLLNKNPISNHNKKLIITENLDAQGINTSTDRNYNAYVYKYEPNPRTKPRIYKIFYYIANDECSKYVEYEALKEIVFTKEANDIVKINKKNIKGFNIKIPEIYSYGRYNINEFEPLPHAKPIIPSGGYLTYENKPRKVIWIEMEFLDMPILHDTLPQIYYSDNKNEDLTGKTAKIILQIRDVFELLMRNNIYNHDETAANIMYDKNSNTIGIIDFGLANNTFSGDSGASIAGYFVKPENSNTDQQLMVNNIIKKIIHEEEEKIFPKMAWEKNPSPKAFSKASPKASAQASAQASPQASPKAFAQAFGKNNFTINTNGSSEDENAVSINDHDAFEQKDIPKKGELSGWFGGKKTKQNKKRLSKKRCKTRRKTRSTKM